MFQVRRKVDHVLAVFHKAINDLKEVAEDHLDIAETHEETAQRFQALAADAREEADRARRLIERWVEAIK